MAKARCWYSFACSRSPNSWWIEAKSLYPDATSTFWSPNSLMRTAREFSKYVFATLNSQCILHISPRFDNFSEMSWAWTWDIFSAIMIVSIGTIRALTCGMMCMVSIALFLGGIVTINLFNDVTASLTTLNDWFSWYSVITHFIASCTTWCTRM